MGERVIVVVGPTAAGKSGLAVDLARALDGEVINADSMQLYRGMDIGTAKLTLAERQGVPHHLLDVWDVRQTANVADYQRLARAAIADITARGKRPILAGGSGLYVRAALDDLTFPGTDPVVRARLEAELDDLGPAALHTRLAAADPAAAAAILPSNGRRIVRALEVIELTGRPFTATLPDYGASIPAVQLGLRGVDPGPGPGRDRPRHPPLRPPPGVLVPPRPPHQLARPPRPGRPGPEPDQPAVPSQPLMASCQDCR
jgi:tRNA dimethylallyltransferase